MNEDMQILLGRYFSGEVSAEEEARVHHWKNATEENAAEFRTLQQMWERWGNPEPIAFDTDKAWQQVDSRIRGGSARIVRFSWQWMAAAAVLILALGIWWVNGSSNSLQTVTADVAVRELTLPDGSIIHLRQGSTLKYPEKFSGKERKVALNGTAFFSVRRDEVHPFVIDAEQTEVKVLGTSFSVNTSGDEVELVVKTGKVQFRSRETQDQSVIVGAGERALFRGHRITRETNRDKNFDAWQSGQLVFENTPLDQVVQTLSGYYNVSISLKKEQREQLARTGVTARFQRQDLASVLKELSLITSFQVRQQDEKNYEISIN